MTTALRRRWPVRADNVAYVASNALGIAVRGNPKVLASQAGISERRARDWLNGDPGSVIARAFELIASLGQCAAVIVAAARSVLMQTVMRMRGDELVRDFWRAMNDETHAEGLTNLRQMADFDSLDDVRDLQAKVIAEAAQLERLGALCGELIEQRIVPKRP